MSNSFLEVLEAALDDAGAPEALAVALQSRGLERVPDAPAERHAFLTEDLLDVLMGTLHPASAEALVERLLPHTHAPGGELDEPSRDDIITVPPSASEELEGAYDDLVSGAIHLRATPPWGLRREALGGATWLLVTADETLLDMARAGAADVIAVHHVVSERALTDALAEPGEHTLLLDGARPSLSTRQVMENLDGAPVTRGFVWRVPHEDWQRWRRIAPFVDAWTVLDKDRTVAEVVARLAEG